MQTLKFFSVIFVYLILLGGHAAVSNADNFERGLFAAEIGDYATAISEWKPLAEQGDALSQYNLGLLYGNEGPFQNFKESFYWYRKSATQGVLEAQYRVGVAYSLGQGVDDNPMAGLMWLTISLIGGNEKAAHLKNILAGFMNDNQPQQDSEKIANSLALECIRNDFEDCYPEESNLEIKKV